MEVRTWSAIAVMVVGCFSLATRVASSGGVNVHTARSVLEAPNTRDKPRGQLEVSHGSHRRRRGSFELADEEGHVRSFAKLYVLNSHLACREVSGFVELLQQ